MCHDTFLLFSFLRFLFNLALIIIIIVDIMVVVTAIYVNFFGRSLFSFLVTAVVIFNAPFIIIAAIIFIRPASFNVLSFFVLQSFYCKYPFVWHVVLLEILAFLFSYLLLVFFKNLSICFFRCIQLDILF